MKETRLDYLLRSWSDDSILPDEFDEFQELLRTSHAARLQFWQFHELESMLEVELSPRIETFSPVVTAPEALGTTRRLFWGGILLGAALAFALVALLVLRPLPPVLATLTDSVNTVWVDAPEDSALEAGAYELLEGLIELTFKNQASLAIEAPASFKLISPSEIRLLQGTLGAHIPETALGFTIRTAQGKVVDHGTDFGVSVTPSGEASAHLFSGEIEVFSRDQSLRMQQPGQVTLSDTGIANALKPAAPLHFPRPAHERVLKVVQGGFEPGTTWQRGDTSSTGVWAGDAAAIVSGFEGIRPYEGSGMLQFLASDLEPNKASTATASQHHQWLDLRPYRHLVDRGAVKLKMRAFFNRVAGEEHTDTQFKIVGNAVSGTSIESATRIIRASVSLFSDSNPDSWEELTFSMPLPAGSDFLEIEILAWEDVVDEKEPSETEFDGHFADALEARLIVELSPAQPSR